MAASWDNYKAHWNLWKNQNKVYWSTGSSTSEDYNWKKIDYNWNSASNHYYTGTNTGTSLNPHLKDYISIENAIKMSADEIQFISGESILNWLDKRVEEICYAGRN